MSARDLAATVREALRFTQGYGPASTAKAVEALAALEKQAADAQAEADAWHSSSDATLARAVRAEEALRRIKREAAVVGDSYIVSLVDKALAAAGADTP